MSRPGISRRGLFPVSAALIAAPALAQTIASPGTQDLDLRTGTVLVSGIHRISANTTIKGDLMLQPGAVIEVAAGRTLILLGGLIAPIATIFTGAGTVDLNRSRIACAHPEWWGAAPGDGASNSLPALHACLKAHPTMQLLAADYYIADTFIVDRPFCRIVGAGFRGTEPGKGTRIVVTSGTADVLRVGPATAPGTVNDFAQNIAIHALALCRSLPVDGSGGAMPAGMRAQFLLFAEFRQVSAVEHSIGFVAQGLVRSTFDDCVAFRSLPGRQAGRPYRGFLLDGARNIGLAGGNASLFLRHCNATIGGAPDIVDGVGLLIEGAFADTFVTEFETAGVATGMRIDGRTAAIGARARNGHVNLHLHLPIIDQCSRIGIEIVDVAPEGMIDIVDPYVAVAPAALAALRFRQMRGAVTLSGGQCVGGTNSAAQGTAAGILAEASHGLRIDGLKILEHVRPVTLSGCNGFALRIAIINPGSQPGGAAIAMRDCRQGTVEVLLSGRVGAFVGGVRLEGGANRLRIDVTGMDIEAVSGAANRVVLAGRSLAVPSRNADVIVDGL